MRNGDGLGAAMAPTWETVKTLNVVTSYGVSFT